MGKKKTHTSNITFSCLDRNGKKVKKGPYVVHHNKGRTYTEGVEPVLKRLKNSGYRVMSVCENRGMMWFVL